MHGSSIVYAVKEFISSPHFVILANRVIIDGNPNCILPPIAHAILVYSRMFSQIGCCVLFISHLLLLKVRSFIFTQIVHKVMPLNNNHTHEFFFLLREVWNFWAKYPICQSRGFHKPTYHGFPFMMLLTLMDKSHTLLATLWSQHMYAMGCNIPTMHA